MSEEHPQSVTQSNNQVDGNMAAGDIIEFHQPKTPLRSMVENYRHEVEQNDYQQEFIEKLQDYMKRVPGHEQRNLEMKLSAAKRDDLIDNAKFLKEKFAKKLYKHTFSPIAQNIFVHILSKINCTFRFIIKPMIRENKSSRLIDNAIYNQILEAIYIEVGNSELGVNMDDILGMLYYLTGNCYIEWEK